MRVFYTRHTLYTKDGQPVGPNQGIKVLHQIGLQLWTLARKTRSRFRLFDDVHNTIWQILFQSNAISESPRLIITRGR